MLCSPLTRAFSLLPQPITIHLKGIYYAPAMAFMLISVSCLDHAGCSLLIKNDICIIQGPCPKCAILGGVPLIHGLYQMHPSTLINPLKPTMPMLSTLLYPSMNSTIILVTSISEPFGR